jgi:hypothetical protein
MSWISCLSASRAAWRSPRRRCCWRRVSGGAQAARVQPVVLAQRGLQRLALATRPAVVLGQLGEAGRQLAAQVRELVEQPVAADEQPPGLHADRLDGRRACRRGAVAGQLIGQARQFTGQAFGQRQRRRQRGTHGADEPRSHRWPGAGAGFAAPRGLGRRIVDTGLRRVAGLVGFPGCQQRLQALQQPLRVATAAVEDTLEAVLAPRRRPLAAAAVEVARQPFAQRRPGRELGPGLRLHFGIAIAAGRARAGRRLAGLFGIGAGVVLGRGFELRLGQPAQGPLGQRGRRKRAALSGRRRRRRIPRRQRGRACQAHDRCSLAV